MTRWIAYVALVTFALYWLSNLILWFPWSYSEALGMTLMLTVSPLIWAYGTFLCLKTAPSQNRLRSAGIVALSFLALAVVLDYVFFVLIRDAYEFLYHPTTFYGYGFVLVLPVIIGLTFHRRIERSRTAPTTREFARAMACGSICLFILSVVVSSVD